MPDVDLGLTLQKKEVNFQNRQFWPVPKAQQWCFLAPFWSVPLAWHPNLAFFCMQSIQFQASILLHHAHHSIAPHAPYTMTTSMTF